MPLVFVGNQIGAAGSTLTIDPSSGAILASPVSGQNLTLTAGEFILGAAASRIVPGATSLSLRNHANSVDNILVSDSGSATVRAGLVVSGIGASATAPTLQVTASTQLVPDKSTSLQAFYLLGFASAAPNTPSGNSARGLQVDYHFTGANPVATSNAGYFNSYNDSTSTVTDHFGLIGRAYLNKAGATSTYMWGVRGDVDFMAAGTVGTEAFALFAKTPQQASSLVSPVPLYAGVFADPVQWTTTPAIDSYGVYAGDQSGASGNNVALMVGQRHAGAIAGTGLFIGSGGAWIKGSPASYPLADTSGNGATLSLLAGDNGGTNNSLVATYFYRGMATQGYLGFDGDQTSVFSGHTVTRSELKFGVGGSARASLDAAGDLFLKGALWASGVHLAPGNAPATPSDGDIWTTSAGIFARLNGTTRMVVTS